MTDWTVPEFEVDGNIGYDFGQVDAWAADAVNEINRLRALLVKTKPPKGSEWPTG